MKFMVVVQASPASETGAMPSEQMLTEMTAYNEELTAAGVMKAGEGLHPSSKGVRVNFSAAGLTVVDGPFTESKELVAGFWIWECASLQDAIDWAKKCPNPNPGDDISTLEIRQIFTDEDFGEALTEDLKKREQAMREQIEG